MNSNTCAQTITSSRTESIARGKKNGVNRLEAAFGVVLAVTAGYTMWCVVSFLFSILQG